MVNEYFKEYVSKKYMHVELEKLYRLLESSVGRVEKIRVDPREALGHVLAEEIRARHERPVKDISHVDGFAVRSSDLAGADRSNPVKLRIIGIDSRSADKYTLSRGETVFVETGHPLPVRADAVIPIEEVEITGEYVVVYKPVPRNHHVFPRGSDFEAGETVFEPGVRINPLTVKVLLDLGFESITVYRKPRVALFSVGDELVDEPYRPGTGKLPASTRYLDRYAVEYYGGVVVEQDILPDDPGIIVERVEEALRASDLVITIGGVSMGPRDHSWSSLYRELKPDKWWRGVKIWPGRSNSGLIVNGKPVINQPGLHQSSLTTLILIITPLLNYMQGLELTPKYPCTESILEEDIEVEKYVDHYRIQYLEVINNKAYAVENHGSYYLKPLIKNNAFTILKPGTVKIPRKSKIKTCYYPPIHRKQNMLENPII